MAIFMARERRTHARREDVRLFGAPVPLPPLPPQSINSLPEREFEFKILATGSFPAPFRVRPPLSCLTRRDAAALTDSEPIQFASPSPVHAQDAFHVLIMTTIFAAQRAIFRYIEIEMSEYQPQNECRKSCEGETVRRRACGGRMEQVAPIQRQ